MHATHSSVVARGGIAVGSGRGTRSSPGQSVLRPAIWIVKNGLAGPGKRARPRRARQPAVTGVALRGVAMTKETIPLHRLRPFGRGGTRLRVDLDPLPRAVRRAQRLRTSSPDDRRRDSPRARRFGTDHRAALLRELTRRRGRCDSRRRGKASLRCATGRRGPRIRCDDHPGALPAPARRELRDRDLVFHLRDRVDSHAVARARRGDALRRADAVRIRPRPGDRRRAHSSSGPGSQPRRRDASVRRCGADEQHGPGDAWPVPFHLNLPSRPYISRRRTSAGTSERPRSGASRCWESP